MKENIDKQEELSRALSGQEKQEISLNELINDLQDQVISICNTICLMQFSAQLLTSRETMSEQLNSHSVALRAAMNENKQLQQVALQSQKAQQQQPVPMANKVEPPVLSEEEAAALLAERDKQLREFYTRVAPDNIGKVPALAAAAVKDLPGVKKMLHEAYGSLPDGWADIKESESRNTTSTLNVDDDPSAATLATAATVAADQAAREIALKQKMEQLMMAALQKQQTQYQTEMKQHQKQFHSEMKLSQQNVAKLEAECHSLKADMARVSSLLPGASEDAITNISYLKNVVVQYMCSPDQKGRLVLWPVIATLLHLTPAEIGKVRTAVEPKGIYALFS